MRYCQSDCCLESAATIQLRNKSTISWTTCNHSQHIESPSQKLTLVQYISRGPYQKSKYVIVKDYLLWNYKEWVNSIYGVVHMYLLNLMYSLHFVIGAWCICWRRKHEKMIADQWSWFRYIHGILQCRGNRRTYIILTDPAILTASDGSVVGGADTGIIVGMAMFFVNHKCNPLCCNLPRPTWERVM